MLSNERDMVREHMVLLMEKIEHINAIVATQRQHATLAGVSQSFAVGDVIEEALRISELGVDNGQTRVARDFEELPLVTADKHKVLDILISVICNAKQAMCDMPVDLRLLTLRVREGKENRLRIEVQDNGMGIPEENLIRVFRHGFTTRADGHGFGLHASANAAKQLAGSLTAHSDGPGLGATFAFEMPVSGALGSEVPLSPESDEGTAI